MKREVRKPIKSFRSYEKLENEILTHSARSPAEGSLSKLSSRTCTIYPSPLFMIGKLSRMKFNNIYGKVVTQLDALKNLTETKKNETENLADLRRQLQRADEFSIRFSRNNIYEMRRIMGDLKKLMVHYSFESFPSAEFKLLCKKIIIAFQAASQGLHTYIKYIKNPSNLEVSDKINELMILIADLFSSCDQLSLTPNDTHTKNNGAKMCNDIMAILKKKMPPLEDLELKDVEVKKRTKPQVEEPMTNNLSMYMAKLTSKNKNELPKKQGISCFFGSKGRRMKRRDEKAARITHEIYTQKMNSQKPLGSKIVKFEPATECEKNEMVKGCGKKSKFTPREVKSQDDDVETMVQTIGDEEIMTSRHFLAFTPPDEDSARSNKNNIRQFLLKAIDELQNPDKKEQKLSLEKLLTSIQHRSRKPNVKVYNIKSKDFDEEIEREKERDEEEKPAVDLITLHEKQKALDEITSKERRLKMIFKPIKGKRADEDGRAPVPRGKIKLKISQDVMESLNKQRKAFYEFRKNDIMYKKTLAKKPWDLVAKVADRILLDLVKDIALDFQNDAILRRLYLNELLEVIN